MGRDAGVRREAASRARGSRCPERAGVGEECRGIGGTVARARALDDLVVQPEAEADAQAVIGLAVAHGGVELFVQFFEMKRLGGLGKDPRGGVVGVFGAAEGLGAGGPTFGEELPFLGFLDQVFLRGRRLGYAAGGALGRWLAGVGMALGLDLLLQAFDKLQRVTNRLARFGGVAQNLDERRPELGESQGLVVIGRTTCPIVGKVVRQ